MGWLLGLRAIKEKVDLDPTGFDYWGYFNPETGKTIPSRALPKHHPMPQVEILQKSQDGKNAVATIATKMTYNEFFKEIS